MFQDPAFDCPLCPRLKAFREENRKAFPAFYNGPVPAFGPLTAKVLVVGLAPGLKGANWSGRPFTGDYAGDLLYPTLINFGFANGVYGANPDDGLVMNNCRITNAVRCVPPQNKPTGPEETMCRPFLVNEIAAMANLKAIVALGSIAHSAVLCAMGLKKSAAKFAHNARFDMPNGLCLFDSYHCSRYNTNTGRLTEAMFCDVFQSVKDYLEP